MNQTPTATVDVASITRIDHDEAMRITAVENRKFGELISVLSPAQWATPTECTRWDVRAMVAHLVGSAASQASPLEFLRQKRGGKPICAELGSPYWWDGMNELQVRERALFDDRGAGLRMGHSLGQGAEIADQDAPARPIREGRNRGRSGAMNSRKLKMNPVRRRSRPPSRSSGPRASSYRIWRRR